MFGWPNRDANSSKDAAPSSGFGVPQLGWLPSALRSPTQNHGQTSMRTQLHINYQDHHRAPVHTAGASQQHYHAPRTGLATSVSHMQSRQSSSLSQPQTVSMMIETQQRDLSAETSEDEDQSESRSNARSANVEEPPSDVDSAGALEAHDVPSQHRQDNGTSSGQGQRGESTGVAHDDGRTNGSQRRYGKRLTTMQEVSLFEICNRHAGNFGHRSGLCKWWQNVAEEFSERLGHPYSWSSVRRKVEHVMKQRSKFLEEQRNGIAGEDLSNPHWRQAVDAFVPSWQRWVEAEARRIERRDSKIKRKKLASSHADSFEETPRKRSSPTRQTAIAQESLTLAMSPNPSPTVRLPPGYGSMFRPLQQTPVGVHAGREFSTSPAATATDSGVMTAVLETLNKLNKHLETHLDPRSSPAITALVSSASNPLAQGGDTAVDRETEPTPSTVSNRLKEELRKEIQEELRRELEADRVALEEKLDSVQRTQDMILEMLRQEPGNKS